jgi:hypothetical protein
MKKLVLLSIVMALASSAAFAQDLVASRKALFEGFESCGQAVYSDSQWFAASLPSTVNGIGHIRVKSLTDSLKSLDLPAGDNVVDVKVRDGAVYVLTETTFEGWNISTAKQLFSFPSHPDVTKSSYWGNKATGFILSANAAIIAHGNLGLSVIDLKTGAFGKLIPMLSHSSAQDITALDDKTAIVAVDDSSEGQFRGLYLLDLQSLEITKQIAIDNAMPLSVRVLPAENHLYVGYINAIWKFDLAKTLSSKKAEPEQRTWNFQNSDDSDFVGKLYFDEQNVYGCQRILYTGQQTFQPFVSGLSDLQLN